MGFHNILYVTAHTCADLDLSYLQICTKRGPLGACLKTEVRTETNDNDKAKKYFRDPLEILREKNAVLRGSEEEEGNALVEKLKAQTETNKEKNRLDVERRTFENDQVREYVVAASLLRLPKALLSLKKKTLVHSLSTFSLVHLDHLISKSCL